MDNSLREVALQTIRLEAESIVGLSQFINLAFLQTVDTIHSAKGRLVISGIGKSGIVGQKIVATLNSTGTPSIYMHAADAIHGDLGMIQAEDVVMLISKSGESPEIKVLVPLIKNFGNVLVGMAGNENSYLATHCDYFLNTTVTQEACPNNLAPTSSTTAQMVMGDALAICLMTKNGFKGTDFARFHPGGNLGKRLFLRVKDLIASNQKPAVSPDAGLKEIIVEITKNRLGATVVTTEEGLIAGIITDGDLRRMLEKTIQLDKVRASEILTIHPKTIQADELAVNALDLMRSSDISQLIVVNKDNTYLGILHLHDLINEGIV